MSDALTSDELLVSSAARDAARAELFANLESCRDRLAALVSGSGEGVLVDALYRLYHSSAKVFELKPLVVEMWEVLEAAAPAGVRLDRRFVELAASVSALPDRARVVDPGDARLLVEAFVHARGFIAAALKYAGSPLPVGMMPADLALLLSLYGLR